MIVAFSLTCPVCGAGTTIANPGSHSTSRSTAIVECSACHKSLQVTVSLAPVRDAEPLESRCGTDRGWHAHHYVGTNPCEPCRKAHALAADRWVAANREHRRAYNRDWMRRYRQLTT